MRNEGTVLLLWIFIAKTASLSFSSQLHSIFRSPTTRLWRDLSPSIELMESIANGTKLAVEQCAQTFSWERWNCPASAFSRRYKHPFSKETAYVQAITAAGVVYAITKSCSKGKIIGCGCDPDRSELNVTEHGFEATIRLLGKGKRNKWHWGGCSDSTKFAENVAKHILNSVEEENDIHAFATRRNNLVGRKIVRDTMVKKCKCQGMLASCSTQTCWMELAPFSQIADTLKRRYRRAVLLNFATARYALPMGNSARASIDDSHIKRDALIYVEDSPDYCQAYPSISWPGTKGRPCTKSRNATEPSERRTCGALCKACGHKVQRQEKEFTYPCRCAFKFCCEVRCDECKVTLDTHYCA